MTPRIQVCAGFSRVVLLVGRWAIKVPRFWSWQGLIDGLSSNLHESLLWRSTKDKSLCPVLLCIAGFVLVMPRASTSMTFGNIENRRVATSVELKPESWGLIDGRQVAVDFGHDCYCFHCGLAVPYWDADGWHVSDNPPIPAGTQAS